MRRVLVTGATGFVGTHVMRALAERNVDAHAARVDLLRDPNGFRDLVSDLRPTHLLHLAWYAVPGKFYTSLENYEWPGATMAAVRAFAEAGGERVTIAGTCVEYDPRFGYCSETLTPTAPDTPYGVAKDAARRLVESYAATSGLSASWARLFFVYGPGERSQRLIPSVIQSLLAGAEARCTDGRQLRDFLHVRDTADALVTLLASDVTGPVNVSSGAPVAVRDVVLRIGEQLKAAELLRIGALPSREEPFMIAGDHRRLRDEVRWTPRFDLASGLADTIEWWRTAGAEVSR
jgi:UDP-glucuronate decarboxylase